MRFRINPDGGLRELYLNPKRAKLARRLDVGVADAFIRRVKLIKSAVDERDLHALRSAKFEKLQRNDEDHSIRLNDQWRLIVMWRDDAQGRYLWIDRIEDYH
jgi:proteic killer suppression protein